MYVLNNANTCNTTCTRKHEGLTAETKRKSLKEMIHAIPGSTINLSDTDRDDFEFKPLHNKEGQTLGRHPKKRKKSWNNKTKS